MNKFIYLDSASSTKVDPRFEADMFRSIREDWYNPSSIYETGRNIKRKIENAKEQIINCLNGKQDAKITFCSCGSEANNLAIKGFMERNKNPLLITDLVSHPSIYNVAEKYYFDDIEKTNVIYCCNDDFGRLDLNDLEYIFKTIDYKHTQVLVATTWVNNETGVINDLKAISEITHKYGGYVLADLCQGIFHIQCDLKGWNIDMATFTSEKIGGCRGCGVLYSKNNILLSRQIEGGNQQEYRPGTEIQYMIIATGNQCERISDELNEYISTEEQLQTKLMTTIATACINAKCDLVFNPENAEYDFLTNNILSVRFEGIDNQELLTLLDQYGVMCSAGSACSAGQKKPSRVLLRIGLTEEKAKSTIRFSFDHTLTYEEIDDFGRILFKCLVMLKNED